MQLWDYYIISLWYELHVRRYNLQILELFKYLPLKVNRICDSSKETTVRKINQLQALTRSPTNCTNLSDLNINSAIILRKPIINIKVLSMTIHLINSTRLTQTIHYDTSIYIMHFRVYMHSHKICSVSREFFLKLLLQISKACALIK
jgi:hypothetical protein